MKPRNKKNPESMMDFLEELSEGSIKESVDDILNISKTIKTAKETLSEIDFRELRDRSFFSDKVWSKLLQIGLDERLESLRESLPNNWTTIYQLHTLTNEELESLQKIGLLNKKLTLLYLTKWTKEKRLIDAGLPLPKEFKPLVNIACPEDLEEEVLKKFKIDLEKLVSKYEFSTEYQDDKDSLNPRQQRSLDKSQEVAGRLIRDLKTTWEQSPENLRDMYKLNSVEDLVHSEMIVFTSFLNKVRRNKEGFWRFHSNDYINKNAMEYLKTKSRSTRWNLKRRLKEVAIQRPHTAKKVGTVFSEWMKY